MLERTEYNFNVNSLTDEILSLKSKVGRIDISEPTGNFFYDPWKIKSEYKDTVWEKVWDSLPADKGQARIMILESPTCYTQHADIDDRYHLNVSGDESHLIDLENQNMYKLKNDSIWYSMDAGILHTAINVGYDKRIQVVVRKLLNCNGLKNPKNIKISPKGQDPRYHFDNTVSRWLNKANKTGIINNFKNNDNSVEFNIESTYLNSLLDILPPTFELEVT